MPIPGHRRELLVHPLRLHRSPRPLVAKIVQHIDAARAASSIPPRCMMYRSGSAWRIASLAAGIFMMRIDQRVDPIRRPRPRQSVVVVVVPEDARIPLMHHDERVSHHLVIHDLVVAHVVIVDKRHRIATDASSPPSLRHRQVAQVVVRRVAHVLQLVAQRKVERCDLVVGQLPSLLPATSSISSCPDQYSPTTYGVNSLPSLHIPILGQQPDHPRAEPLRRNRTESHRNRALRSTSAHTQTSPCTPRGLRWHRCGNPAKFSPSIITCS